MGADLIRVAAGDTLFRRHMCEWLNAGALHDRSAARPEVITLRQQISAPFFWPAAHRIAYRASELAAARIRLKRQIIKANI